MRYCPACHSVFPNDFRTCPKDQAELRTASDLQPGMVLRGKYEILDKVGAGGMASVYRARHLAFNEVCAIKVVAGRLSDDEDFLRRFRNEAVVARRFQHAHAVRVDDLDTTEDGRPFIVMEYVEGPNLREVVRREGALGLPSPAPAGTTAGEEPAMRDARIRADVLRGIYSSPRTRTGSITVDVDNGEVTLGGHAASRRAAGEAEDIARSVAGVTLVANEIEHDEAETPEAALEALTHDIPVAQLLEEARDQLKAGDPESAMQMFTAVLALDPQNREAQAGLGDAGRLISARVPRPPRRVPSAPPPPAPAL